MSNGAVRRRHRKAPVWYSKHYLLTRLVDRHEAALLLDLNEAGHVVVDMLANVVEFGGTSSEAVKLRRWD